MLTSGLELLQDNTPVHESHTAQTNLTEEWLVRHGSAPGHNLANRPDCNKWSEQSRYTLGIRLSDFQENVLKQYIDFIYSFPLYNTSLNYLYIVFIVVYNLKQSQTS